MAKSYTLPGAKFYLNKWIFACISGGSLIFLDLKADRYISVDQKSTPTVLSLIHHDMLIYRDVLHAGALGEDAEKMIYELCDLGILTIDPATGKILMNCKPQEPISPFEHIESDEIPAIYWHHVICAFLAGVAAHVSLKFVHLNKIINKVRYLIGHSGGPADPERALMLARIYQRLRPVLLRSRLCLFDSLSFIFFARIYGVCPNLIFGVRADPFEAHCWVQLDGVILNDVPQNIKLYTPIMTI